MKNLRTAPVLASATFSELGRHLWNICGEARDTAGNRRGAPVQGLHGKERLGGDPGETQGRESFKEEKTPSTWLRAEQDEAQNWPSEHRKEQTSHEERTWCEAVRADAAERGETVWRTAFSRRRTQSGGTQSLYKVYVNR